MLDAAEFSGLSFVRKHSPAARRPAEARFHRLVSARKAKPSDGALDRRAYGSDSRTVEFLGVLAGPWRRKAGFRVHIGRRQGHPAFQLRIGITDDLPRMRNWRPASPRSRTGRPCPKSDVDLGRPLFGGAHRHQDSAAILRCGRHVSPASFVHCIPPFPARRKPLAPYICRVGAGIRNLRVRLELREPPRPCGPIFRLVAELIGPFDGCCRCPTDEVEHENRQRTVRYLRRGGRCGRRLVRYGRAKQRYRRRLARPQPAGEDHGRRRPGCRDRRRRGASRRLRHVHPPRIGTGVRHRLARSAADRRGWRAGSPAASLGR